MAKFVDDIPKKYVQLKCISIILNAAIVSLTNFLIDLYTSVLYICDLIFEHP